MQNAIQLSKTDTQSWIYRRGYRWFVHFYYHDAPQSDITELLNMMEINDADYLYHTECGMVIIGINDETIVSWLQLRYG